MSGVFAVSSGAHLASFADVKIPDNRIELRSKRFPGTREDGAESRINCTQDTFWTPSAMLALLLGLRQDRGAAHQVVDAGALFLEFGELTPFKPPFLRHLDL
jgi:hypothetical protein